MVGKDTRELPFLADRSTSMLYIWYGVPGLGHPELGGFRLRLVREAHVTSHFGLENWESNGPHVWAKIGDVAVDPTFADTGVLPILGEDLYE